MILFPKAFQRWRPSFRRMAQLARKHPVWSRKQKGLALGAASGAALSIAFENWKNWSLCETHQTPKDVKLSSADEAILLSALDGALENLLFWTEAPANWWDECWVLSIGAQFDLH
eukprot:Skav213651  [mRNA]  locus=scaffold2012:347022:347897:- [translate_table: standard]